MRRMTTALILILIFTAGGYSSELDSLQTGKLTVDRMKLFPVPKDNINYVFMQSIENDTAVIIGDFSGVEKKIIMIIDKNADNTIDSVVEYFPFTKDLRVKSDSKSKFYNSDIAALKKSIINGTIYKGSFTDSMKSLKTLERILADPNTRSLVEDVYGFSIKEYEVDELQRNSAVFKYGKVSAGYYLQFKTDYYRKDHRTMQKPVLGYSVYCRDSNDPVVKETVENLFKIRQPDVNTAKAAK